MIYTMRTYENRERREINMILAYIYHLVMVLDNHDQVTQ